MRLNKNQIEHLAFLVVRNLQKDGKVIIDSKDHLVQELTAVLNEEFQKEDQLDQEVREILTKHIEEIRKGNIEYQTMFRMIKTKLAKEKEHRPVSARLSREKVNSLSKKILELLAKSDNVEFLDDPNEIRLSVVRAIEEEMKLYDQLDKRAMDKIKTQKKPIEEGSREWEILYRKYYNEELAKIGKLSE